MAPPPQAAWRRILFPFAILGYWGIGLTLSTIACGLTLWATGGLPEPGDYEVYWQGQLGTAMGVGFVATAMATVVWPLLCLVRALRWSKAWWFALALANGLMIVATLRPA